MRSFFPSRATSRRDLRMGLPLLLIGLGIGPPARAGEEVHLTREAAIVAALPGAARLERALHRPTAEERRHLAEERGVRVPDEPHELVRGFDAEGRSVGVAMFVDEVGKYRPITFIVALDPEQRIRDVRVCVYRESHGGEITRRRFLRQFHGRRVAEPMRLGREVVHIGGATLSCRATIRAAKRVLAVVDHLARKEGGLEQLRFEPWTVAATERSEEIPSARRPAMGTLLDVSIDAEPRAARAGFDAVFHAVAEVTACLDGRLPDSDVARLLAAAPGDPVPVSTLMLEALARAREVAEASGGAFDPTLREGGWRQLGIDRARGVATRGPEVERLDFGGIGKGIALDRAAAVLRDRGLERALLNFGGQLLALEAPRGRAGWAIELRGEEPAAGGEARLLVRGSIATSGERFRGAHLIDPSTGRAARVPLVTRVWADDATTADAWSTACALVPGLEERIAGGPPGVRRVVRIESAEESP
jgi:thiamine biosynthesis lipoprotein